MASPEPAVLSVEPPDPRRIPLADLTGRLVQALAGAARLYAAAAAQADGALRQTLEALGQGKERHVEAMTPLARSLGQAVAPPPVPPASAPRAWGVVLGEAFQQERGIQRLGWELAALAEEPEIKALAGEVATEAVRAGAMVRKLYLRYS